MYSVGGWLFSLCIVLEGTGGGGGGAVHGGGGGGGGCSVYVECWKVAVKSV